MIADSHIKLNDDKNLPPSLSRLLIFIFTVNKLVKSMDPERLICCFRFSAANVPLNLSRFKLRMNFANSCRKRKSEYHLTFDFAECACKCSSRGCC